MDQMNEEKAKIEAERAESQRMMAELLELKKQLAQQNASTEEKTDTPDGE